MDSLPSKEVMDGDTNYPVGTSTDLSNLQVAPEFNHTEIVVPMDPWLYEAAMNGDIVYLEKTSQAYLSKLQSGRTISEETAPHITAEFDDIEIATPMNSLVMRSAMDGDTNDPTETLIDLANLHSSLRAMNDETVLHIATGFQRIKFTKFVVQHCPQLLWLQNSSGDTPLHIAARGLDENFVEFFLRHEKTSHVEIKNGMALTKMLNKKKDTALHCAARNGSKFMVEMLVKADNEVCNLKNDANESPLYLSIVSQYQFAALAILKNATELVFHKGENGLTALHFAVLHKNFCITLIEKLVEKKIEMIKEGDNLGMTPLHYAAFYGNIEAVKLFIKYESQAIGCKNNDGQSAIYMAAFNGRVEVLKELIKCRPDYYDMVDNKGRTALHAVVLGDQPDVVRHVFETPHFVDFIDKMDNDGNTALHLAAHFKFFKIIKLLHRNCKQSLNNDFLTPFDLYNKHFYNKDLRLLQGEKYSHMMIAYFYLNSYESAAAKCQSAKSKLNLGNIEPTSVKEKKIIGNEIMRDNGITRANFGEESSLEVNLLVAMLVATVTFAAGFTVPGGLVGDGPDKGQATLTNNPVFQAFIVFNTLAFFKSILAVLIHFRTSLSDRTARIYHKGVAAFYTTLAILFMLLAFCFGTSIVLTKSISLSLTSYSITASFLILYPLSRKLNKWIKLQTFGESLDIPLYLKVRLLREKIKNQQRN